MENKLNLNPYAISLKEAAEKNVQRIDIGGTAQNVLEKNKIEFVLASGIKEEQIIIVLDPFDLSRAERRLPISTDCKTKFIKFEVDVGAVNDSAETVSPPSAKSIIQSFEQNKLIIVETLINKYRKEVDLQKLGYQYDLLKDSIAKTARGSKNLYEFMSRLTSLLVPPQVKIIPLEQVLSKNTQVVYNLLKRFDINARAICPNCNKFAKVSLKDKTLCCSVSADKIIENGKYIPEDGFFGVILYLSGYIPCISSESKYGPLAIEILKKYGIDEPRFVIYDKLQNQRTMFESYIIQKVIKNDN